MEIDTNSLKFVKPTGALRVTTQLFFSEIINKFEIVDFRMVKGFRLVNNKCLLLLNVDI